MIRTVSSHDGYISGWFSSDRLKYDYIKRFYHLWIDYLSLIAIITSINFKIPGLGDCIVVGYLVLDDVLFVGILIDYCHRCYIPKNRVYRWENENRPSTSFNHASTSRLFSSSSWAQDTDCRIQFSDAWRDNDTVTNKHLISTQLFGLKVCRGRDTHAIKPAWRYIDRYSGFLMEWWFIP